MTEKPISFETKQKNSSNSIEKPWNWSQRNIDKAFSEGANFLKNMQGDLTIILTGENWDSPIIPTDNKNAVELEKILKDALGENLEVSDDFPSVLEFLIVNNTIENNLMDVKIEEYNQSGVGNKLVTLTKKS